MSANIVVVETDRQISQLVHAAGLHISATVLPSDLGVLERQTQTPPDVLVLDVRGQTALPSGIAAIRRRFTGLGVVLVASELNPALMLEAMRVGVSEFVTEPLSVEDVRAGIERAAGHHALPSAQGRVLAFVGAKGGVGTTTLAVNVATALAMAEPKAPVLMVDMHVTTLGDASVLLGVEPKFSVMDAFENAARLDATYLKSLIARTRDGLDVLVSPERPSLRAPEGNQIRGLLESVALCYGVTVLDVQRTHAGMVDSLEPLSMVTLVLNQELTTVRRAAQLGAILRQRYGKDKVDLVVTRHDARADITTEDIERVVGLPIWAVLPSDYRKVIASSDDGRPFVTDHNSRLAAGVRKLAKRLAEVSPAQEVAVPSPAPPPQKSHRLLGSLFQ